MTTNNNSQKLIQLIQTAVQIAVKKELTAFKSQFLNELASINSKPIIRENGGSNPKVPSQSINHKFREAVKSPPKKPSKFSSNSTLNEILSMTKPITADENYYEDKALVDLRGVPVNANNKAMRSVEEAINRDYSEMFKPSPPKQKPMIVNESPEKVQLRNKFLTMMEDNNYQSGSQPNFDDSDDEDLSWLDRVG